MRLVWGLNVVEYFVLIIVWFGFIFFRLFFVLFVEKLYLFVVCLDDRNGLLSVISYEVFGK